MKKLLYLVFLVLLSSTYGCMEEFLDTEDLYSSNLDTYYKTPDQINEAMGGVYHALYAGDVFGDEHVVATLLSDLVIGGGGADDQVARNVDGFTKVTNDVHRDFWTKGYEGVARVNAIIESATDADYSPFFKTTAEAVAFKNQTLGEAHFMRAFHYFRMAKFFGGMPLILKVDDPKNVARATFDQTFAQIASDLKMAIEYFPAVGFTAMDADRYGHANQWVAQAYMARVYLFYTGYMTNIEKQATATLPLVEGGSVSKNDVVTMLDEVIANSEYDLADDFRNLWPYSYVNQGAGDEVLPWAAEEGLAWVGQGGLNPVAGTGNYETMFSLRYSFADWGWTEGAKYHNRTCLYFGIRGNGMIPFGEGWGWGYTNPEFFNNWDDADERKLGSVLELGSADQGTGDYAPSATGYQMTPYMNKKYTNLQYKKGDNTVGMFADIHGVKEISFMLRSAQDFILLRFSDVLLMHSELTETVTGINRVRDRAALDALGGYSIEALKKERMYELAFEGLRWFDLVRWGDVETAFGEEFKVITAGVEENYSVSYRAETKGLISVPESEISLSGGVLEQNKGWE